VGHEIDLTIADLVADQRAPTPSAAAELAVPVLAELEQRATGLQGRLERAVRQSLRAQQLRLERVRGRLGTPSRLVDRSRMQLDDLLYRLQRAHGRRAAAARQRLSAYQTRLGAQQPRVRLARHRAAAALLTERLEGAMRGDLQRRRAALGALAAGLQALSPLLVLARGYGLVRDDEGRVVSDAAAVTVGQRLRVRLARGELRCVVEGIRLERT
jgi:exodeoxyribonuclease VII large subunit